MVPLPAGAFSINFDTAIRDFFSVQAAVYKDSSDCIFKVTSQVRSSCDSNFEEALTVQLAISLTVSLNFNNFILKGNSLVIIMVL